MVRLVFRPYAQVRRTICTSVSLRASTRVSPGFTHLGYRSPSFGSKQICSSSNLSVGRSCKKISAVAFTTRMSLPPLHSHTCLTPWSVFQDGSPVRTSLDIIRQCHASLNHEIDLTKPVHASDPCVSYDELYNRMISD